MKVTVHARFYGRVQGVNFRNSTYLKAMELGIVGWVKNLPDGSVEGIFSGEDSAVNTLLEYCRNGIRRASVTYSVAETVEDGQFDGFEITG